MNKKKRVVYLAMTGWLSGGLTSALLAGDPLESVQSAAGEWAKIRAETVRIESDWEQQRGLLETTRDVLQERVKQREAKRDELEAATATERRNIDELTARRQAMGTAAQSAEQRLQAIDARLLQMRVWLPPRLSAALELPYRSLANPKLTLGERMQHTMTVLNRCQQFNNAVTCGEEPIPVAGGEAKLMEVIYWGLSHGYALDRGAKTAYYGTPGETGWSWAPASELVSQIERLIAVNQDKTEPTFVEVPLALRDPAALQPKS